MYLDFGRLYWLKGRKLARAHDTTGSLPQEELLETEKLYEKSTTKSWDAKKIFERLGNKRGLAKSFGNLGNVAKELARYEWGKDKNSGLESIASAEAYYRSSLKISQAIERRDEIAHALWGLAEVSEFYADCVVEAGTATSLKENLLKAKEQARKSHEIYTSLGGGQDIDETRKLVERIQGKLDRTDS